MKIISAIILIIIVLIFSKCAPVLQTADYISDSFDLAPIDSVYVMPLLMFNEDGERLSSSDVYYYDNHYEKMRNAMAHLGSRKINLIWVDDISLLNSINNINQLNMHKPTWLKNIKLPQARYLFLLTEQNSRPQGMSISYKEGNRPEINFYKEKTEKRVVTGYIFDRENEQIIWKEAGKRFFSQGTVYLMVGALPYLDEGKFSEQVGVEYPPLTEKALFEAVREKKYFDLLYLLDHKPNFVNLIDRNGNIPLYNLITTGKIGYEILSQNIPVLELILERGADVDFKKGKANLSLLDIIMSDLIKGQEQIIIKLNGLPAPQLFYNYQIYKFKLLLEYHSDVNAKDEDGSTPLHYAAYFNLEEFVKLLFEAGADPYIKNNDKKTPIDIAIENGFEHLFEQ